MNFSLVYLANSVLYRFFDFFRQWYVNGSRVFFHQFISFLENLDETFAVRVTFRYFFQPLYKDYTIVGRILGVFFRTGRIVIGVSIYAFVAVLFLAAYLGWLLIPVILIFYVFKA